MLFINDSGLDNPAHCVKEGCTLPANLQELVLGEHHEGLVLNYAVEH